MRALFLCSGFLVACAAVDPEVAAWKPAAPRLLTRWAADVDPAHPHPDYPRPGLVRDRWRSLNGIWQLAEARADEAPPLGRDLDERVLVPFPLESALSGVGRPLERAWYRRTFEVPRDWRGERVLLHFGAVDWHARVWVDGAYVGEHVGGFDAFHFDVTAALGDRREHEVVVGVFDPTDAGGQMRGKQVRAPEGIWYTPSSGIWQTVWIEPVPATRIERITIDTRGPSWGEVEVGVRTAGDAGHHTVRLRVLDGERVIGAAEDGLLSWNSSTTIDVGAPEDWTAAHPKLYELEVELCRDLVPVDRIRTRFGFRRLDFSATTGARRPLAGVLDQGFWPDGLYTAPSDAALRSDVELTKRLGYDFTRKHVKVEPARWYAHCDELGLPVWQDLPSSSDAKTPEQEAQFERELRRIVEQLANHVSIAGWVVFNEGWGQYDTARLVEIVRSIDPTRPITNASGWVDDGSGDVVDVHVYPGPAAPPPEDRRVSMLGEFGGLGLYVEGHAWRREHWGYQGVADADELTERYVEMWRGVHALGRSHALAAAVYTQLTDVETECNGLVTYDRAITKIDVARAAAAHRGEFPALRPLVRAANTEPAAWRYRFDPPERADWASPDADDSSWREGTSGFGTPGTPGAVIGTTWDGAEIWLRRWIEVPRIPDGFEPWLLVHHDEDARVWIDGELAFERTGYSTAYERVRIRPAARVRLTPGRHVLAMHVRQTRGGQYADCGIELVESSR